MVAAGGPKPPDLPAILLASPGHHPAILDCLCRQAHGGYAPGVRFTSRGFLVAWLVLGCEPRGPQADDAGQMTVRWDGSPDGSVTAPASATWCELRRRLEVRSIRGDTGIALAVYPSGRRPATGSYPMVEPAKADSVRPAAGLAVRWLARNLVQGFRGDSGQLQLKRSSTGQLSGQVQARARSVVDTQRITLTATFQDLMPRPDSLDCTPADTTEEELPPDDTDEPGDTMVD